MFCVVCSVVSHCECQAPSIECLQKDQKCVLLLLLVSEWERTLFTHFPKYVDITSDLACKRNNPASKFYCNDRSWEIECFPLPFPTVFNSEFSFFETAFWPLRLSKNVICFLVFYTKTVLWGSELSQYHVNKNMTWKSTRTYRMNNIGFIQKLQCCVDILTFYW